MLHAQALSDHTYRSPQNKSANSSILYTRATRTLYVGQQNICIMHHRLVSKLGQGGGHPTSRGLGVITSNSQCARYRPFATSEDQWTTTLTTGAATIDNPCRARPERTHKGMHVLQMVYMRHTCITNTTYHDCCTNATPPNVALVMGTLAPL